MNVLANVIREDFAKKKRYFRQAEQEIAEKNLRLMHSLTLVTVVIMLVFFAITPFIIDNWTITLPHILFLPAVLILHGISALYQHAEPISTHSITALCLLFEAVLFSFSILIDVLPYPSVPSAFVPVLLVALPALFILPFRYTYSLIFVFELIYIAAVTILESPMIGQYDIFGSIVGVIFSIPVAQVILRLRIQDHEIRMKYKQLSTQDTLSGILNKKACEDAAQRYLLAFNPRVTCMLLVLDIDDFKLVNDRSGHYTGDLLLRNIADLLSETFRTTDVIGRFGGDEFMVLVKGSSDYQTLANKCRALQDQLSHVTAADCSLQVTCSIGGVLVNGQEVDFETLFRQADDALYKAKGFGKNRFVLCEYHPAPERICRN